MNHQTAELDDETDMAYIPPTKEEKKQMKYTGRTGKAARAAITGSAVAAAASVPTIAQGPAPRLIGPPRPPFLPATPGSKAGYYGHDGPQQQYPQYQQYQQYSQYPQYQQDQQDQQYSSYQQYPQYQQYAPHQQFPRPAPAAFSNAMSYPYGHQDGYAGYPTAANNQYPQASQYPAYEVNTEAAERAQWEAQYQSAPATKDGRDSTSTAYAGIYPASAPPANATQTKNANGKELTVRREGGGKTWEDKTLLEWDPNHFRVIVGNLAGEVTDESLAKAFGQYNIAKARVVRDHNSTKSRGYGFVSFYDAMVGFRASREMRGSYIGSHPVTVERAKADLTPVVSQANNRRGNKNWRNNRNKYNRYNDYEEVPATSHNVEKTDKIDNKQDDPLRAHTGGGVEKKKKSTKKANELNGLKIIG